MAAQISHLAGGGAGLGGAIFVKDGAALVIKDVSNISSSTAQAGAGVNNGAAAGNAIFVMTGNPLKIITSEDTQVGISNSIADDSVISLPPGQGYTPGTASGVALIKQGPGLLGLFADNTYAGLTDIQQGTLLLNGSVAGNVVVEPAGTLTGLGIVKKDLTVNGAIAPGDSSDPIGVIGILHIGGNYVQNNGSFYDVRINGSGQSSLIDVAGAATLNGGEVVVFSVDGQFNVNNRYTILNANGGLTGTFSGATFAGGNPFFVRPVLSYDPNHAFLRLQTSIINAADTFNERQVANQLDSIENPTASQAQILNAFIGLSIADARRALDEITGEQYTNDPFVTELINRQFIRRLYDPLRSIVTTEPCNECCSDQVNCCDDGLGIDFWLEGSGGRTHVNGNRNARGFRMKGYEISFGAQTSNCNEWTFGAAASYEKDRLHYKLNGTGKLHTWLGGIYALYRPACFYVLGDLTYGCTQNKVERSIRIGGLRFKAHSKPKISQVTFYTEAGMDYAWNCFLIQPFLGIEVDSFWRKHIFEHDAGDLNLVIKKKERTDVSSRLGVHLTAGELPRDFSISADLAWLYSFIQHDNDIREHFSTFGSEFTIKGVPVLRNSFEGAVTVSKKLCNNWIVYVEAYGEVWNRSSTYNILGGVQTSW